LDEGVHVGDRDPHAGRAPRRRLRDRELVEVLRVVVVDRDPQQGPQVADALVLGGRRPRDLLQLGLGLAREVGLETALDHGTAGDRAQIVSVAAPLRLHGAASPINNTLLVITISLATAAYCPLSDGIVRIREKPMAKSTRKKSVPRK